MASMERPENDKEFDFPSWKLKLDTFNQKNRLKDIAYQDSRDYFIEEKEIALKHPETGSIIKLTDEGYADLFAGPAVGIRIDPITNSINFYGDSINFVSKNTNIVTKPNGLAWNGYYFNPDLYMESDTSREQMVEGTKNNWVYNEEQGWHWERQGWSVRPMISTPNRRRYSDGMVNMLKDLGIPIE